MSILTNDSKTNIQMVKEAAAKSFPDNPILANLCAAQAILESRLEGAPSELAAKFNNLFGIKGEGTAGSVTLMTHEYYGGSMHLVPQKFAANSSVEDSFEQHKKLFDLDRYKNVKAAKSFEEAATAVWKSGYATDPHYPKELMSVYKRDLQNE